MTARRTEPAAVQTVSIVVDRGFNPSSIRAKADMPLRLLFSRLDPSECAGRVVFSSPRMTRHLAVGSTTLVELPALPEGRVRFTCGMGRYSGEIELVERRRWLPKTLAHALTGLLSFRRPGGP